MIELLGPVSCLIRVQDGEFGCRHFEHLQDGGASPPDSESEEEGSTDREDNVLLEAQASQTFIGGSSLH